MFIRTLVLEKAKNAANGTARPQKAITGAFLGVQRKRWYMVLCYRE